MKENPKEDLRDMNMMESGKPQRMKIPRNNPCPCGNGKKFKKCHGKDSNYYNDWENTSDYARNIQKEKQFGKGKTPIQTLYGNNRAVVDGEKIVLIPKEQTIHEFLYRNIIQEFTSSWLREERDKVEPRHPIIKLFEITQEKFKEYKNKKQVAIPSFGAISRLLKLSWNLYNLRQNNALKNEILTKIKRKESYFGYLYESDVYNFLIKAGCKLDYINEKVGEGGACDVNALFPSGKSYSIEITRIEPKDLVNEVQFKGKIHHILAKKSDFPRIGFIELGVPNLSEEVAKEVIRIMDEKESNQKKEEPYPSAHIFVTNQPYEHGLTNEGATFQFLCHGFNIKDFNFCYQFKSAFEYVAHKEKYQDIYQLMESLHVQYQIPNSYSGEEPEFEYEREKKPRLIIGNKYVLPCDGKEVIGVLEVALVNETEKKAFCYYCLEDGNRYIYTNELSDLEMSAYKRSPDTFFCKFRRPSRKVETLQEFFDFFYETCKLTKRDILLEHLKGRVEYNQLKRESQKYLAIYQADLYAKMAYMNAFDQKENCSIIIEENLV